MSSVRRRSATLASADPLCAANVASVSTASGVLSNAAIARLRMPFVAEPKKQIECFLVEGVILSSPGKWGT